MLAALPMYDLAELRSATDALWAAIAARLVQAGIEDVPASLSRDADLDAVWTDPALLLAQTCGYPLVTTLRNRVTLVATPRYAAPGCDGAAYRSAIVVRAGDPATRLADLRGRRCAVNDFGSNSGMNLLRAAVAPLADGQPAFFAEIVVTGAHAASIEAVAGDAADVAAIDCVTWAQLRHHRPNVTAALRVLAWTAPSPGLPLITSRHTSERTRHALLRALHEVAGDPALHDVRAALLLDGFEPLPLDAYEAVLELERDAATAGYSTLR